MPLSTPKGDPDDDFQCEKSEAAATVSHLYVLAVCPPSGEDDLLEGDGALEGDFDPCLLHTVVRVALLEPPLHCMSRERERERERERREDGRDKGLLHKQYLERLKVLSNG